MWTRKTAGRSAAYNHDWLADARSTSQRLFFSAPAANLGVVQRKVQQSGSLMKKLQDSVNYESTADTGPEIPEMFKQPLRMKCTPPQELGNDGMQGAWSSTYNSDADGSTRTAAAAVHSQDKTGMTLLLGDLRVSELDPRQGIKVVDPLQIAAGERADLGCGLLLKLDSAAQTNRRYCKRL
ncbi:hypothetical protein NDU88_005457 [Pleurodeles waltl]|uniref:Uncharacterized protein n=1 Tax=Pleurodeles waltl TaxID=8319 RepID=A0AAV7LL87_PLEWA|nr:hypothetical protein NDU88_005457 [Pleurodeles waltl]